MLTLEQSPPPSERLIRFAGDVLEITLRVVGAPAGTAWLRTSLGNAAVFHREVIAYTLRQEPRFARHWHDLPLRVAGEGVFRIQVPLAEVGRFQFKTFFLPAGSDEPVWPEGGNVVVKVEPAATVAGNSIYTAFVRQFGPNRVSAQRLEQGEGAIAELDEEGYTVIPASGTFRDLVAELDFIIYEMGFGILQLLPIHPTPTTYARMGRFGSPFAALDLMDVDPALAVFDRRTTPLDQFGELVAAVHARGARLFMDMPINHTGWASRLQAEHPEWFSRGEDEAFVSPGAWGVTWEDLSELDYDNRRLWVYMAQVFLHWCREGVDGFRCDAGYMIPRPVWQYIVAAVRNVYPDTVFLLEGLGGKREVVEDLLDGANLNWAYSELFQDEGRDRLAAAIMDYAGTSEQWGLLVHFAETHDNHRLAARSPLWARHRTALAAVCSVQGAFGITNGVEWLATERVDVHQAASLNWGADTNQVSVIRRLNAMVAMHPAFHAGAHIRMIPQPGREALVMVRTAVAGDVVLVGANLQIAGGQTVRWPTDEFAVGGNCVDLVSGETCHVVQEGDTHVLALRPGQVVCLCRDEAWGHAVSADPQPVSAGGAAAMAQRRRAKVLALIARVEGFRDLVDWDVAALAERLAEDPLDVCGVIAACRPAPVTGWQWPADVTRTVPVPSGDVLFMQCPHRFRVDLLDGERVVLREDSMENQAGGSFALLLVPVQTEMRRYSLVITVFEPGGARRAKGRVLSLARGSADMPVATAFSSREVAARGIYGLCTNPQGAMSQVPGIWGHISSQYDALLAVDLNSEFPEDRYVMLTRCRCWVVHRGYSHELGEEGLCEFCVDAGGDLHWQFTVPVGLGKVIRLVVTLRLDAGSNALDLEFARIAMSEPDALPDDRAIRLILRPDIEDRISHHKTKAYAGPEGRFPAAVSVREDGFGFAPQERELSVSVPDGTFTLEPEWQYMIPHPHEADRGLDGSSDLFSPGYFEVQLRGGQTRVLSAAVAPRGAGGGAQPPGLSRVAAQPCNTALSLEDALRRAMRQFVVSRGDGHTVIAGFPWFLDWGRDTMICLRGMIVAGLADEAAGILKTFARFEDHGTLPNVIHGGDVSNRDTSDAPLWFLVACRDLCRQEGNEAFLDTDCGGRCIRDVVISIAQHYRTGTQNGIVMDAASGLIFSPSHFTWMDTNFPAGTPREGYPIEIQALWCAGLSWLAEIDPAADWAQLAARVGTSIGTHYWRAEDGYLADCLHGAPGTPAAAAEADDALRPNQLFAITLGAVQDREMSEGILRACEALLVPGAIRSLADRPVAYPITVMRDGRLLNDPARPYWPRYCGDEDTRRKPAYHNGTAWTWPFASYAEAWFMTYGAPVRQRALDLLGSATSLLNTGCAVQVPEIVDGSTPHKARGCGAQAWGCTELYRVLAILQCGD